MKKLLIFLMLFSYSLCLADDNNDYALLNKDDKAPFKGYLISEEKGMKLKLMDLDLQSKIKVIDLQQQEQLVMQQRLTNSENEVNQLNKQLENVKDNSIWGKVGFFILGAAVTGLVAYGVTRAL